MLNFSRLRKKVSSIVLFALMISMFSGFGSYAATDDLYDFGPEIYSFTSEEDLMAKIISSDDFISDHAGLADLLGFGWCGGTASKYVGEDFKFTRLGEGKYSLKANYRSGDPYASGYQSDQRLEMIFDNVKLYIDGDTLEFGKSKITELEPVSSFSSYVVNDTDEPVTRYPRMSYTTGSSWSREDNVSFGQSLMVKNKYKFDIGFMGSESEISVGLDFGQGWSTTNGTSEQIMYEERIEVPLAPHTKKKVEFIMLEDKADIPYNCNTYIEYDVTYKGFLRWGGNAHNTHPTNRPVVSKTFGSGDLNAAEDLLNQYKHRDINGYSEWDWKWIADQGNQSNLYYYMSSICKRERGGIMNGTFTGVSGAICHATVSNTEYLSGSESVSSGSRVRRSLNNGVYFTDVEIREIPNVNIIDVSLD